MTPARNIAAVLALAALAACSAKEKADEDVKATASVKTLVAQSADTPEILISYGAAEVAPSGEKTLSAPVEAVVSAVPVSPGAQVKAGQLLIALTPSAGTASELTKSAGELDVASKAYARAQRLRASGLDSDADVEQARALEATAAEAYRSLAARVKTGLGVRAPSDGVVETITAAVGDLAAPGASLGKFGSGAAVRVHLGLEPSDAKRVRAGDRVTLRTLSGPVIGSGVVTVVESRVDPQTHLAGALVEAHAGLTEGQAVQGDIVLRTVHAPTVAKAAIVYDQDQPNVFVVTGGVAHRRAVTLGPAQADQVALVKGLRDGERVVVEGAAPLDDGMTVAEAGAPAKAAEADDAKP